MATTDTLDLDQRTRLTDTKGAARRLGFTPETLRNLRYKGGGPPFVKLGRSVRYRLADLAIWLEERTRTSTSDDGSAA